MLDRYDQDLLLDYLEGELDADRAAQLQAMLAEDDQLAALIDAMGKDRAALRALPQAHAPADLTHDVTQSLERRMLLDDQAVQTGPVPITRGRDLPGEPSGGLRWGRVAGLSALAASVALAAGIVVISLGPDPLIETADSLGEKENNDQAPGVAERHEEAGVPDQQPAIRGDELAVNKAAADERNPTTDKRVGTVEALLNNRIAGLEKGGATDPAPAAAEAAPAGRAIGRDRTANKPQDSASQPAVALAVTEPRQQLVLLTEQPDMTREQLVAYCVTNGIPIVQTNRVANGYANNLIPILPDAALIPTQPAVQPAEDNYALLVDEQMLDKLLRTMNDGSPVDAEPLAARSTLSNQIAMLADLDTNPPASPKQARAVVQGNPAEGIEKSAADTPGDSRAPATPDNAARTAQQPIELRLPPDLGSPFANTLNRNNFAAEQQRTGYPYKSDALRGAADAPTTDTPAASEESFTPEQAEKADAAASDVQAPADPPAATTQDRLETAELADPGDSPARKPKTTDPSRGNWLAPHLPLAHTTPILHWRQTEQARSPQLVPILIQLAPTEQVNSVRSQQQSQLQQREAADTAEATEANDAAETTEQTPAAEEADRADESPTTE